MNTLIYHIVIPVKLEMQKKGRWTTEGDESLTDGEEKYEGVEEDNKKKNFEYICKVTMTMIH